MSALSKWFQPCSAPLFGETTCTVAPAAFSAFTGSVSSTCSTPSVARTATMRSFNSSATCALLLSLRVGVGFAERLHHIGNAGEFLVRHTVDDVHHVLLAAVLFLLLAQVPLLRGELDVLKVIVAMRGETPAEP